jgi:uncharacterized membrane protein YphA (DoxX/SURF4 family)
MTTKARNITYWTTTVLIAFFIGSGGVAQVAHVQATVDGFVHILGYPAYFVTILGVWKVLGAIAILVPRFPRLKEWAYAGIFFNMTGAFASHGAVGDGVGHLVATGLIATLAVASWALRPQSRKIGTLFPRNWGSADRMVSVNSLQGADSKCLA